MNEYLELATILGIAAGASKPLVKLVETVAPVLVSPAQKILDAKADAVASRIKAVEKVKESHAVELETERVSREKEIRAQQRVRLVEDRRQDNLEDMFRRAAQELPQEVSEEPVNEDWFFRWINSAQDVGDKQVQSLWSKILAGEVAKPGSYSLRTLEILKNLSKEDANLFKLICEFSMTIGGEACLIFTTGVGKYLYDKGIHSNSIAHLEFIGLIHSISSISMSDKSLSLTFGGEYWLLSYVDKEKDSAMPSHKFTSAGNELFPLCDAPADAEYADLLEKGLKEQNIGIIRLPKPKPSGVKDES